MATRVTLHYGGQEYKLAEGEEGILTKFTVSTPSVVTVGMRDGGRVALLAGPGIHAAVTVKEVSDRERGVIVL